MKHRLWAKVPRTLLNASGLAVGLPEGLFFFQAEDGIRDLTVTGVQTCALPISMVCSRRSRCAAESRPAPKRWPSRPSRTRSEERRVGKSVDLGGRRIIKKKKKKQNQEKYRKNKTDTNSQNRRK